MRRAIIIILSLLFMFGVAATVYCLYSGHTEELEYGDLILSEKYITSDGRFEGLFGCNIKGRYISDYEYTIQEDRIYLTIFATAAPEDALPTDEEGYTLIEFPASTEILEIFYVADGEETMLAFGRR